MPHTGGPASASNAAPLAPLAVRLAVKAAAVSEAMRYGGL